MPASKLYPVLQLHADPFVVSPGQVLTDPTGQLRVLVLTGGAVPTVLSCDGALLTAAPPRACSTYRASADDVTALAAGACYVDEISGVELRCLVPHGMSLAADTRPMRRWVHPLRQLVSA